MTSSYIPSSRAQSDSFDYQRQQQAAGDKVLLESIDDDQEYKQQQEARREEIEAEDAAAAEGQAQKTQAAAEQLSPPNPIQEIGTAVVGAGIDAVESVGATAQATVTGQLNNPEFKPTWLQMSDEKEPMNRTMWGNALRGIGEYVLLDLALRKVARGAKSLKVPGTARLSTALSSSSATTKAGKIGREAIKGTATGAVAGFIGSGSQGETVTTELNKMFPHLVPDLLVTDDDDSPLERKLKNVVESVGVDGLTTLAGAAFRGARAGMRAQKATKEALQLPKVESKLNEVQGKITKKVDALLQTTGEKKLNPDQNAFLKADPEYNALLDARTKLQGEMDELKGKFDPDTAAERHIAETTKRRDANFDEKVQTSLLDDPDGVNANAFVNKPLFDPPDSALLTPDVGKGGYYKSLVAAFKMDTDAVYSGGRRPSVYTEAALEKRLSQFDPERRKIIEKVGKELEVELNNAKNYEGKVASMGGYNVEQLKQLSTARYIDLLDDVIKSPEDISVLKAAIEESDNYLKRGDPLTGEQRFMGLIDHRAVEMLVHTTAGEISDIAVAGRSIHGVLDNSRQLEALTNRLEFMLLETGRSKYVRGFELNGLKRDPAEFVAGLHKKEVEVKQFTNNLKAMFQNDPDMVKHWLDVMAMADGNVKAFDELYKYANDAVFNWQSLVGGKKSAFVDGMQNVLINSMLAGPKTVARAVMGSGLITFLRPVQTALGGALMGDAKATAMGLAMAKTSFESIGEALKVGRMAWSAGANNLEKIPFSGNQRVPLTMTDQWRNVGAVIMKEGTATEKGMYNLTSALYDFNNWIGVKYPQTAFGAIDAGTAVIMGRMEAKMRALDKAWDETGGKNMGELIQKYEKAFNDDIFDHGKQMLKSEYAVRMADEASLKLPLGPRLTKIQGLVNDFPLMKATFAFMKTGWNALDLIGKHTPLLNNFNQEVRAVLSASGDDLTKVAAYGIDNPLKLLEAQANIKGRIATGYLTVGAAMALYMNGGLTGNGPANRETKNAWIQSGWRARSIKVGDRFISYDSLEPFTSFLAMTADIGDNSNMLGEPATQNMMGKLSYLIAQNVTNKSFMAGLMPLQDLMTADPKRAGTWLANLANNHIPWAGFRNELANIINPGMRELDDDFAKMIQTIMNRNPGLKGELPVKYDILDGSVVREFDPLTRIVNAVSPLQINFTDNETRRSLRESGYDVVHTLSTDDKDNKLDAATRSRLQNLVGQQKLEKKLEKIFARPDVKKEMEQYKKMRDLGIRNATGEGGDKQYGVDVKQARYYKLIHNLFKDAKQRAMAQLNKEYPELRQMAVDRATSKVQQNEGRPNQALQRILQNQNR